MFVFRTSNKYEEVQEEVDMLATVWQLILLKGQQRLDDYNQCEAFLSLLPFKIANKTSEPQLRLRSSTIVNSKSHIGNVWFWP